MKEDKDILSKTDRRSGMTVPDGYFDDFAIKMAAALPQRDEAENPESIILPSPTLWTRIRPYAYLAAMFAGVWCMLKMFTLMSTPSDGCIVDRNPILAEAFGSDSFINEYVIDDINQWDLLDEMMDDGFDAACLEIPADSGDVASFVDPASIQSQDDLQ